MARDKHVDFAEVCIGLVENDRDVAEAYSPICRTFGEQTNDGFWVAMNPDWGTAEGRSRGAAVMVDRWRARARDSKGRLNTMFIKATVPNDDREQSRPRKIVGAAIWLQASVIDGRGDPPVEDLSKAMDLERIYPGNKKEQRYLCQVDYSLHRQRIEYVKRAANASPPSVMVLDLCVVDPAYQGRGIARRMVQWGLDEAKARGGMECITEASVMGKPVYEKLGFRQEGFAIEYVVDEEFARRNRPANAFMRRGI